MSEEQVDEIGYVYVINAIGTNNYKIGHSYTPPEERRLKEGKTWSTFGIKIILIFRGSQKDERRLHEIFEPYHSRDEGEWFILDRYALFAMIINTFIGSCTVPHRPGTDKDHIKTFVSENFYVSPRSPTRKQLATSIEDVFNIYQFYCKQIHINHVRLSDLRDTIVDIGVGRGRFNGELFFSMVLKEDSSLVLPDV